MKAYQNINSAVICPACQMMMPRIRVATAPPGTVVVTCTNMQCENDGKQFTHELPTIELTPVAG